MRTMLLTSVAAFGLALAAPAMAENTATAPTIPPPHKLMREGAMNPATGARWGHTPGIGLSLPVSPQASNITSQDTRSIIAPTLPKPALAENAAPAQFLAAARDALARGQTGAAQEALERAMTRRLDRDSMRGIEPSNDPMIGKVRAALDSLAGRQFQAAQQDIADAMPVAAGNGGMQNGEAMNTTGIGGPTAPYPDTGVYQAERHHTTIPGNQGVQVAPPGSEMNPNGSRY